ncbi:LURP-one-related protein [Nitzschia inconspicua]|uniref:LURP-one-related protein n=1 Tax=Nitzschia inconspicua TaxID=303405 RepID=A0A9K3M5A2_9STRA|nr:LURP-one-related protein [Nitzschia inconspicua]
MNVISDIGEFLSGGKLEAQTGPLPYGAPLGEPRSEIATLAVQERALSFTGEDFDVWSVDENAPYCTVRGAMLHLPGKDKMRIKDKDSRVMATLDRKLVALTPTYDIQRGDGGEKIGCLEKATIALTDTFDFHAANSGGFGPFKPPPAYKLEGDFLDRRFIMKNDKGQVVAKISQDKLIEFDQFNHYQIRIAPGMDPVLVIACACAIDEEFDELHKKRREEQNR